MDSAWLTSDSSWPGWKAPTSGSEGRTPRKGKRQVNELVAAVFISPRGEA